MRTNRYYLPSSGRLRFPITLRWSLLWCKVLKKGSQSLGEFMFTEKELSWKLWQFDTDDPWVDGKMRLELPTLLLGFLTKSRSTESALVKTILGWRRYGLMFGAELDWVEYGLDLYRVTIGKDGDLIALIGILTAGCGTISAMFSELLSCEGVYDGNLRTPLPGFLLWFSPALTKFKQKLTTYYSIY